MKKVLTIYFLLQFSFGYTQCIEGDCENGTGTYKYEKIGALFKGEFKDGLRFQGKMTYKDGSVYQGEFKDGLMSIGKITYKDGPIEEGEFNKAGRLNGQGKRTYKNGTIEEGEFKKGKFKG